MSIRDFYDFEGAGVIRSKAAKARVFLFAGRQWADIEAELLKTFSTGASVMLAQMGRSYGTNLAKEQKRTDPDPAHVLEAIRVLAGVSGWGVASLSGNLTSGDGVEITVSGCIFCSEAEKRTAPACHFLAGVVQGVADEAYGGSHHVKETSCIRTGASACVLTVAASQR